MPSSTEIILSRMKWTAVFIKYSHDYNVKGENALDHFRAHYELADFFHSGPNNQTYHLVFDNDVSLAMFKMEYTDELNITSNWMDIANNMISIQPITVSTGQVFRINKNRGKS